MQRLKHCWRGQIKPTGMERKMKKFLLATIGLQALVGMPAPASAADMAVKARPPAPMLPPIYDWTGFYIGANGGWGQSHSCVGLLYPACVAGPRGVGGRPR